MTEKLPVEVEEMASKSEHCLKGDKSRASLFLLEKLSSNEEGVLHAIAKRAGRQLRMDKVTAMAVLMEKIAAHQKTLAAEVAKKMDRTLRLSKSRVIPICLVAAFVVFMSQGYCADANASGLDSVTKSVMDVVFGGGVKKTVLAMAGAWGVFQSVSSGSFKPLLLWGGIGLAIAYVPRLIEIIANVG